MNAFFLLDGQVVTPGLTGSILAGITRKSVISLLERWGIPVAERRVEAQELVLAYERGLLQGLQTKLRINTRNAKPLIGSVKSVKILIRTEQAYLSIPSAVCLQSLKYRLAIMQTQRGGAE